MCGSRSTTQQFQFQNYFISSIYLTVPCLYDKNVLKICGTNLQYTLQQPHLSVHVQEYTHLINNRNEKHHTQVGPRTVVSTITTYPSGRYLVVTAL